MVAINAAWETIGDPKRRASFDRLAVRRRPTAAPSGAAARGAAAWRSAARLAAGGCASRDRPGAALRPPVQAAARRAATARTVSRDWTPGRSTVGGGYDAEDDARAGGLRRRRPAAGQPVGQRPELRPLRRLVARRGRAGRSRVHRMARSDADRAAVSRRDRRDPAPGRTPEEQLRQMPRNDGACSGGAERRSWLGHATR